MNKNETMFTGETNAVTAQEILVGHNSLSFDQSTCAGDILLPGIYVDLLDSHEVELVSVCLIKQTVVVNISKEVGGFSPVGLGIQTFKANYKRK